MQPLSDPPDKSLVCLGTGGWNGKEAAPIGLDLSDPTLYGVVLSTLYASTNSSELVLALQMHGEVIEET